MLGAGATLVFVGCLFPSFDELKGQRLDRTPVDDDDDDIVLGKKDSGKTSSTSSGGSTTSGDPGRRRRPRPARPSTPGPTSAPPAEAHRRLRWGRSAIRHPGLLARTAAEGAVQSKSAGCDIWTFSATAISPTVRRQRCCKGGGSTSAAPRAVQPDSRSAPPRRARVERSMPLTI